MISIISSISHDNINIMNKKKFILPRYILPTMYVLAAIFVLLLEWGDRGFFARVGTVLITAPWSVWIPDWYNYNFSYNNGHMFKTDIRVLLFGVMANVGMLYFLGRFTEYIFGKLRSVVHP